MSLPYFYFLFAFLVLSNLVHSLQNQHLTLQQQTQFLLRENFQGVWRLFGNSSLQGEIQQPWTQVQGKEGIAIMYFSRAEQQQDIVDTVIVDFLMPKYQDRQVLRITINLKQKYNTKQQKWQDTQPLSYQLYNKSYLINSSTTPPTYLTIDYSLLTVKLSETSTLTVSFSPKYLTPLTPFLFSTLAFIIYLMMHRKQNTTVAETNIKHNIIPIVLSNVLTFVVFACEIVMGVRSLFGKMSPQAFFTVAACINLGVCYRVGKFYWAGFMGRAWGIVVVWAVGFLYIWFLLFFRHNQICIIINSLVLLPQIGYHCLRGRKIQPDLRFLFFILSNQVYILYFKSCPSNMFHESASYTSTYWICSLLVVQTLVYLGQIYISPRFLIPSILRSNPHNYYNIECKKLTLTQHIQCHICLEQIKIPLKNLSQKQKLKQGIDRKICNKNKQIMITPCQHLFHTQCLEKWMMLQMKCPVDRLPLPAF